MIVQVLIVVETNVFGVEYARIGSFEVNTVSTLVIVICTWTSPKRRTYSLRIDGVRSTRLTIRQLRLHSILIHDEPTFVCFIIINTHS